MVRDLPVAGRLLQRTSGRHFEQNVSEAVGIERGETRTGAPEVDRKVPEKRRPAEEVVLDF